MAERDEQGEVFYAASTRGPTAYTAFISQPRGLRHLPREFAAMSSRHDGDAAWTLRQSS